MTLLQMPGKGAAVAPPEHGMHMYARFAIRPHRDVADQGSNLDLFLDGLGRYCFVSQSKNASFALLKASYPCHLRPAKALFGSELLQAAHRFVPPSAE
jgi:hypothetical protein